MRSFVLFCVVLCSNLKLAIGGELSSAQVKDAQKLYLIKCAKCHKFYDPTGYNDADWNMWMEKMSKKSRLKEGQKNLLTRYLGAVRATEKLK